MPDFGRLSIEECFSLLKEFYKAVSVDQSNKDLVVKKENAGRALVDMNMHIENLEKILFKETKEKDTDVDNTDDESTDDESTDDESTDDESTDDESTDDESADDESEEGGEGDSGQKGCPEGVSQFPA